MTLKVILLLDPADRALADQLNALSGQLTFESDKADGNADVIAQVLSVTAASLSVLSSYLTLRHASPRSTVKDATSEKPLDLATVEELRARIDDDASGAA